MGADLSSALLGGCRGRACRLRLDNAVTVHTDGGKMRNTTQGAAHLAHLLATAAEFADTQAPLAALADSLL
jgi:hypothetical protein